VWRGDYQPVTMGAYFAQCLSKTREEGRIVSNVTIDRLMQIKTAWDITAESLGVFGILVT
jgi:hypothetical protein